MSTDAGSEGHVERDGEGASEEDVQRLVEQLRSAPAEPIIADTFSTLLSTAQIKLGRRDARLFIDLCSVMLEYADRYVSAELGTQVEKALGQLRLGQVSAESEVAKQGEPEPNDLSRIPAPPATSGQAEAPVRDAPTSPTSKLWVPGH